MKAVLISIQPKWCELIANGEKTLEVRKTRPKIETPFKCYIYCTHDNRKNALHLYVNSGYGRKEIGVTGNWRSGKDVVDVNTHLPAYRYNAYLAEGKVIGEFVCDAVEGFRYGVHEPAGANSFYDCYIGYPVDLYDTDDTCLTRQEIDDYGNKAFLYGWHISDLKIYDKPRELREFKGLCKVDNDCDQCPFYDYTKMDCNGRTISRPPQSWCYVEELT